MSSRGAGLPFLQQTGDLTLNPTIYWTWKSHTSPIGIMKKFIFAEHKQWLRLCESLSLDSPTCAQQVKRLTSEPGLYAWTVNTDTYEVVLYIGQASSLQRRIYNYSQPFQPHSPNDRKLYFAQRALTRRFPEAQFSLYWQACSLELLNEREKKEIHSLSPVLNVKSVYSKEHTAKLEQAYSDLYEEVLEHHFSASPSE